MAAADSATLGRGFHAFFLFKSITVSAGSSFLLFLGSSLAAFHKPHSFNSTLQPFSCFNTVGSRIPTQPDVKMGRGFLVPENYVDDLPNENDMNVASIAWGLSLGVLLFNVAKAVRQTRSAWTRRKKVTSYIALLWAEIISSTILGIMCWFYLEGTIKPSMQFFFFISKMRQTSSISA